MSVLDPSTLTQTAEYVRSVYMDRSGDLVVNEFESVSFACALLAPKDSNVPTTESSPRVATPSRQLWYMAETYGVACPALAPGHRVRVDGVLHELTGHPRAMRLGPTTVAYRADTLAVDDLYRSDAFLQKLGGEFVCELTCSIWQATTVDRATARAAFVNPQGEAPAEFYDALHEINLQIELGDKLYKVQNVSMNTQGMFCAMNLTKQDHR